MSYELSALGSRLPGPVIPQEPAAGRRVSGSTCTGQEPATPQGQQIPTLAPPAGALLRDDSPTSSPDAALLRDDIHPLVPRGRLLRDDSSLSSSVNDLREPRRAQIDPPHIPKLDQPLLSPPRPLLELLLARDGCEDVRGFFEVDEARDTVLPCERGTVSALVMPDAPSQVIRDAYVEVA